MSGGVVSTPAPISVPVQPPLVEDDATGQGRLLIVDRDWVVVSQSPAGGTHAPPDTQILLRCKKVGPWLSSATMKWVAWLRHGTWTAPVDSAARLGVADSLQW